MNKKITESALSVDTLIAAGGTTFKNEYDIEVDRFWKEEQYNTGRKPKDLVQGVLSSQGYFITHVAFFIIAQVLINTELGPEGKSNFM